MKASFFFAVILALFGVLVACSPQSEQSQAVDEFASEAVLGPTPAPTTDSAPEATEPALSSARLDDAGLAPEIANGTWINSAEPLTLASQRGKVVLLEFWTFGCINCQRVTPYLRQWYEDFAGEDFQVIAIHYPEFPREREFDNVVEATQRFEIDYPVALDNDGRTWRAYQQRYWPTTYLIDKKGHIRYKHIGEFSERSAVEAEAAIDALLVETSAD